MRRAHEEPYWGRFICRFALGGTGLHGKWSGPLVDGLTAGMELGRFKFRSEQIDSVVMFVAGAVLSSMFSCWRASKRGGMPALTPPNWY